jgi:pimeloyl-ACP methyl ester carboxylesterase
MMRDGRIGYSTRLACATLLFGGMLLVLACKCGVCEPGPAGPAPPAKPGPFVQGPAGKLFIDDGGKGGVPVILVHGLGCDHTVWAEQLQHLRTSRRAVALDLRGYGRSDPDPKGDYSMEAFAADVAAVAERLGISRYVLVGHSMSGPVILACAAAHPDRVAGLLFDDPAGDLTQIPKKDSEQWLSSFAPGQYEAFREKWFGEMLKPARPEVCDKVLGMIRSSKREVVEASARGLAAYDPKPALRSYAGPMLSVVIQENNEPYSLHKIQPSMKVVVVEGASHWVMMDKPAEFDAALDGFLSGIPEP